jgi:hypothetical protein
LSELQLEYRVYSFILYERPTSLSHFIVREVFFSLIRFTLDNWVPTKVQANLQNTHNISIENLKKEISFEGEYEMKQEEQ